MTSTMIQDNGYAQGIGEFGLFSNDQPIPLKSTDFSGYLKDMMTHMTMKLVFENTENQSIEAVYTFPIPDDAVFLGLSLAMNQETYKTVIMERSTATESYEETVTDGNAAILVEEVSKGLYSMQVGNIPANSHVSIEYEYSLLHEWKDDLVRWRLPTVLAPRYGVSNLLPHHEPEVDILAKHDFSFSLKVEGLLYQSSCSSPSHGLNLIKHNDGLLLSLTHEVEILNKDIIIQFQRHDEKNEVISSQWDLDLNEQFCALLSLCTPPVQEHSAKGKIIKILIDCSGSMQGESIKQARVSLREMLQTIRPQDKVMIWKFGSSVEKLQKKPIAVSEIGEDIYHLINADLGGTKLFKAMTDIAKQNSFFSTNTADIFLITDGDVWNSQEEYARLIESMDDRQRVFSVGVGQAVSTEILNNLAKDTGGSVELLTVNENMASRITSHFKRLYAPRINRLEIDWPLESIYMEEAPTVFSGDTVYIAARFMNKPEGIVTVRAEYENGGLDKWNCQFNEQKYSNTSDEVPSTLARTIAFRQMKLMDEEDALKVAINYQLMSEQTACFADVVLDVSQQSNGQPAIRKVASMLADGYAGVMAVEFEKPTFDMPMFSRAQEGNYLCQPSAEYRSGSMLDDNIDFDFEDNDLDFINDESILKQTEDYYLKYNSFPKNESELHVCGFSEKVIKTICEGLSTDNDKYHAIIEYLYKALLVRPNETSKTFSREIRLRAKDINSYHA